MLKTAIPRKVKETQTGQLGSGSLDGRATFQRQADIIKIKKAGQWPFLASFALEASATSCNT